MFAAQLCALPVLKKDFDARLVNIAVARSLTPLELH
jgi:hypothetical protein